MEESIILGEKGGSVKHFSKDQTGKNSWTFIKRNKNLKRKEVIWKKILN